MCIGIVGLIGFVCMIYIGDCLEVMCGMVVGLVDVIVIDLFYGLLFMGKCWDYDVFSIEIWVECLCVLKFGGYLLVFVGICM